MVKKALHSHVLGKSAGPDEISPAMLRNLPSEFVLRFSELLDAILTAGHTPLEWRQARVVFIPKPLKDNYNKPGV